MLMHIFGVAVGMTFSGGFIDLLLFGILPGNAKTNWIYIIIVGVVYFVIYYFLFSLLIKKFNYKTPGREDIDEETKLYTKKDYHEAKNNEKSNRAESILTALGGKENLSDIDCCATRLRLTVKNPDNVNDGALRATGASGVIKKGNGVQIIYGPKVTVIKSELEEFIGRIETVDE